MKFWSTLWKRIHQDHTESSSTRIPLDRAAVPLVQTFTGRMIGMPKAMLGLVVFLLFSSGRKLFD